jgi:hypothetical protein
LAYIHSTKVFVVIIPQIRKRALSKFTPSLLRSSQFLLAIPFNRVLEGLLGAPSQGSRWQSSRTLPAQIAYLPEAPLWAVEQQT